MELPKRMARLFIKWNFANEVAGITVITSSEQKSVLKELHLYKERVQRYRNDLLFAETQCSEYRHKREYTIHSVSENQGDITCAQLHEGRNVCVVS